VKTQSIPTMSRLRRRLAELLTSAGDAEYRGVVLSILVEPGIPLALTIEY